MVVTSLDQLDVDITSLVAMIAASGHWPVSAGHARNLASGMMRIFFLAFKDGYFIEAGGVTGTVEKINILNTLMRTGDNRKIIVPNGAIYGDTITNCSACAMVFGIG